MTTAVQRRRGTKTEHESFTGLEGEITVNTTNESLHVHDGSTTGGFETMRADGSNATSLNLNSTTNVDGVIDDDTMATASATKLSTSESIKAYVDNQVGSVDTLSEILDNGNTSGTSDIIISSGQSLTSDTISETTVDAGVTIDSVLLKDDGVNATNIEITNLKANDGTAAGSIADTTGAVTLNSFISNSVDIGGGSIDGTAVGASSASTGAFTTIDGSDITITDSSPTLKFIETDASVDYQQFFMGSSGANMFFQTRDSTGTLVSIDYQMGRNASGATDHNWSIAGTEKLSLNSTGLSVTDDLDVGGDLSATSGTFSEAGTTALFLNRTSSYGDLIELQRDGTTRAAIGVPGNNSMSFDTGGTERMRINSVGKLLIGTTYAAATVNVGADSQFDPTDAGVSNGIHIVQQGGTQANGNYSTGITFSKIDSGRPGAAIVSKQTTSDADQLGLAFLTHGSTTTTETLNERAVLDHNGNFLVAKTGNAIGTVGVEARASGQIYSTVSGSQCLELNRLTSAGNIVRFWNYTSVVGTIGSNSGNSLYIGSSGVGTSYVRFFNGTMRPATSSGANNDNAMDLGASVARWDDVYATNGTIQTSDEREKQDIESLSEAEHNVAVSAKSLLRKYRWKSSVEEKGDDARIHFGIIAQDLKAAFEAEGLDAGRYAMFIHSEWWEHDVEVPAVEAQDAVYEDVTIPAVTEEQLVTEAVIDDEGNEVEAAVYETVVIEEEHTEQRLVSEAVEAVDAYTRTDTYETEEEAPEGAVKKDRMGIRYSELLAFIIAAL